LSVAIASNNLARPDKGDCIDPTNLPSRVSLEGIEAITLVSSASFSSPSKYEPVHSIFSLTFFVNSLTLPKPDIASSFETTSAIWLGRKLSSISTSNTSLKAILIRVFLARVKVAQTSLKLTLKFVISSTDKPVLVVKPTDLASFIKLFKLFNTSTFCPLVSAMFLIDYILYKKILFLW
jgi:hypothetical protein